MVGRQNVIIHLWRAALLLTLRTTDLNHQYTMFNAFCTIIHGSVFWVPMKIETTDAKKANNGNFSFHFSRSTVRVLKFDSKKEDVAAVEEIILEDKAAGRLPIMCIANVHSAIFQVIIFMMYTEVSLSASFYT